MRKSSLVKYKPADVLEDWAGRRPRWIQIRRQMHVRARIARLRVINLLSRRRVDSADGPVVSLTTYGLRIARVHITIEAIANGSQLPSQLILWLDEDQFASPPAAVKRLMSRGLDVRRTKNYGPHKKYFPFITEREVFDRPLVTADDDVLYPSWWLEGLMAASEAAPGQIHCYRAHRVGMAGQALKPYGSWERGGYGVASIANFATGVSGVSYPSDFLYVLRESGDRFLEVCPRADDVWLHKNAVEHDFKVNQIHDYGIHFNVVPGTQGEALMHDNVTAGANDAQITATYSSDDLLKLTREIASVAALEEVE
jgi:hypothetical protein